MKAFKKAQQDLKVAIEQTTFIQWIKNNPVKVRLIVLAFALLTLTMVVIESSRNHEDRSGI